MNYLSPNIEESAWRIYLLIFKSIIKQDVDPFVNWDYNKVIFSKFKDDYINQLLTI